jgi:signal transduction histidine kinase
VAPDVDLRGNRALLTQMISNLLENAIEHTPAGTTITLALNAAADSRTLIVQDDGPGIPPTESERIFDRFYRLDRSHTKPGNGLGLSLVRSICGLHGFTVRLSPNTSGARFEISM